MAELIHVSGEDNQVRYFGTKRFNDKIQKLILFKISNSFFQHTRDQANGKDD
jgi:hypothetical protein